MKNGSWIPLSNCLMKYLPLDREYTKLEAAFSLQLDYDKKKEVTVSGYASLWRWSRKKVNLFFTAMGMEIVYSENTQKRQNQKGQIRVQIRNRSGTDKEQIRLIDNNNLPTTENRTGTDKEQIRDRSGSTTINTNTNNKTKHREVVLLKKAEYDKLLKRNGEKNLNEILDVLNNYKMSSGKKYKSDYHAILNWVEKRVVGETSQSICPECKKPMTSSQNGMCESCNDKRINERR